MPAADCSSEMEVAAQCVFKEGLRRDHVIDFENKSVFKLKHDDDYAEKVQELLIPGENTLAAFKSMRDGVVFTSHRIIAVNVQGMTGSKKDFTSLPYKNIVAYSVETSGTLDIDTELELYFSSVGKVRFEFSGSAPIKEISGIIAQAMFG